MLRRSTAGRITRLRHLGTFLIHLHRGTVRESGDQLKLMAWQMANPLLIRLALSPSRDLRIPLGNGENRISTIPSCLPKPQLDWLQLSRTALQYGSWIMKVATKRRRRSVIFSADATRYILVEKLAVHSVGTRRKGVPLPGVNQSWR